jgi:subtilisin family serine protease
VNVCFEADIVMQKKVSLLFIVSTYSLVVRLPIQKDGDRKDFLGSHGIVGEKYVHDDRGSAYLAVIEDDANCVECEIYEPHIDFGDSSCIQVETLFPINRTGFWERRATSRYSAEVTDVDQNSKAREMVLLLENIIGIWPCSVKQLHRGWLESPLTISQTYTIVQLQEWAAKNDLTGQGQTVVLIDTGINYKHLQFGLHNVPPFSKVLGPCITREESPHRRVEAILVRKYWVGDWDLSNEEAIRCGILDRGSHGTHCSGILAGEKGGVGLAGKSKIIMVNNSVLANKTTCKTASYLSGMSYYDLVKIVTAGYSPVVFSNSWGAGISYTEYYTAELSGFDTFLFENPSSIMLFAAGNGGQESFSLQALARNAIAVGSTTDRKRMSTFSSAGPTIERNGRMTVHVVTNGQSVLSAGITSDVAYTVKSGTSMATPLAAGIATLLREWLVREEHQSALSGAMLRTLMIHCAVPLPGVDKSAQGFGFLQPSLITDYGKFMTFVDHRVNQSNPVIQLYENTVTKAELFRLSYSYYTTPGYWLENVVTVYCLKNEETSYNRTDILNTLGQVTLQLSSGDKIECWLRFVRAHDNSQGIVVSVAVGTWPTYVIYVPDDIVAEQHTGIRMGAIQDSDFLDGVPLATVSWAGRDMLRDLWQSEPVWLVLVAMGFVAGVFIVFMGKHLYNDFDVDFDTKTK